MNQKTLSTIYSKSVSESITLLETDQERGLVKSEVIERQTRFGANEITQEESSTLFQDIVKQLINPLALILLVALGLTLFLGEYLDALVIAVATIINVVIAVNQERRAGAAFQALSSRRAHSAVVVRDGAQQVVDAHELVPGDIVMLTAGQYVPADGRVVSATRLAVNQVAFTGESMAVSKTQAPSDEKRPFDRNSMVFMGSTVMTGTGVFVVSHIGSKTEFGSIAEHLAVIEKDLSPIQKSMAKIARMLGIATVVALVILIVIGFLRGFDLYTIALLAIAVGVSAVPEGLLSAVTVVLAYGARNIMKMGGLVKNLASAETLGSATFILTDKTGTLTHGEMKTEQWYTYHDNDQDAEQIQHIGALATDVFFDVNTHKFVGDEMDTAIVGSVLQFQEQFEEYQSQFPVVDTIPFDSKYKFFASLRSSESGDMITVKGAPSVLIEQAEYVLENGQKQLLSQEHKDYFSDILHKQSKQGRRLLAICYREDDVDDDSFTSAWGNDGVAEVPSGLVFCGLVSFYDKVRSSVPSVIAGMRDNGTHVVMITGDSADTAHQIALESGVISDDKEAVYVGSDIDNFTDEHLLEIMQGGQARIFARVTPDHKLRLATILQDAGEVVAMTGDGVNDAPALQKATIGISLSSSTEVAKEAADLVLVNDSFDTIAYAISEGRRMVSNLKKTIIYLLSTSFSEVFVLMGSLVVFGPTPFYPTQILWANIIEEGLMNFGFIFEPNHHEKHQGEHIHSIMNAQTKKMIIWIGVTNGLMLFAFYLGLLSLDMSDDMLRTYMFAALSIDSIFFGLALKSLYDPVWTLKLFSNMYLIFASLVSFILLIVALEVPFLRSVLHLEVLSYSGLAVIFGFGILNLFMVEAVKKLCR